MYIVTYRYSFHINSGVTQGTLPGLISFDEFALLTRGRA